MTLAGRSPPLIGRGKSDRDRGGQGRIHHWASVFLRNCILHRPKRHSLNKTSTMFSLLFSHINSSSCKLQRSISNPLMSSLLHILWLVSYFCTVAHSQFYKFVSDTERQFQNVSASLLSVCYLLAQRLPPFPVSSFLLKALGERDRKATERERERCTHTHTRVRETERWGGVELRQRGRKIISKWILMSSQPPQGYIRKRQKRQK